MNSGDPGQEMDIDDGGVKPSVSSLVLQPYVIALDSKEMQGSVIDMIHNEDRPNVRLAIITTMMLKDTLCRCWTSSIRVEDPRSFELKADNK